MSAMLLRRDVLTTPTDPPGGFSRAGRGVRPSRLSRERSSAWLLEHSTIVEIARVGKQLTLIGADAKAPHTRRFLCVHLGMTGRLEFVPADAQRDDDAVQHVHARWMFEHGTLRFVDARRFGGLKAFDDQLAWQASQQALGPDALLITGEGLFEAVRGSRRAIKAALLDQGVLAGVGNIYADEALYLAGLRPSTMCTNISLQDAARLSACIVQVLHASISSGGSTRRDFVDGDGKKGSYQDRHAVYGRGGQTCVRCGTKLRQATIAQRTTVWCPNCQPASSSRFNRGARGK